VEEPDLLNQALKRILTRRQAVPIIGVHDALSAKLAENEGFEALWLSGFGLSTIHGVRDANELPWNQVLQSIEYIAQATRVPLLVDADTGYGDFNTARIFARRAQRLGAAGLCVEDKRYPKLNSFAGGNQQLESPETFAGKLRAMRDATDGQLCLVARTEALIVGASLDEALARARCYSKAGADAILVHSKRSTFDEIEAFMQRWVERTPVVIVPTTYDTTPASRYLECGVSGVIWANQALRASVLATSEAYRSIYRERTPLQLHPKMASMRYIFELVGNDELLEAERKYAS
jgi:phosphoenolpyruvate phosphomutase